MQLLALDTSTDTLSVAVARDDRGRAELWTHTGAGGAQASLHLIATIERLMAEAGLAYAGLDAICFGAGPGSFTGLRTACSVAQGLGFGAGVPLLPVDSLQAVAEEARCAHWPEALQGEILVALDARMNELYVARWAFDVKPAGVQWRRLQDNHLLKPEALPAPQAEVLLAGNALAAYGARLGAWALAPAQAAALPTAAAMLRLAPALLADGRAVPAEEALPLYVRDKVAQTTEERAAQRDVQRAAAEAAAKAGAP